MTVWQKSKQDRAEHRAAVGLGADGDLLGGEGRGAAVPLDEAEGEGLIARCFCHELAHLEGQLYTAVAERMLTEEELKAMMEREEEEEP